MELFVSIQTWGFVCLELLDAYKNNFFANRLTSLNSRIPFRSPRSSCTSTSCTYLSSLSGKNSSSPSWWTGTWAAPWPSASANLQWTQTKTNTPTHIFRILVQASLDEILELFRIAACQLRRVVLRYQKEHPHRMQLRVGGFAFGQLDRCDAQAPDVRLQQERC